MKQYDILIIGAGPGGIFSAFELIHRNPSLRVAVFETGKVLEKRRCPIDGKHVKECILFRNGINQGLMNLTPSL